MYDMLVKHYTAGEGHHTAGERSTRCELEYHLHEYCMLGAFVLVFKKVKTDDVVQLLCSAHKMLHGLCTTTPNIFGFKPGTRKLDPSSVSDLEHQTLSDTLCGVIV
jgi:hypothetical protein